LPSLTFPAVAGATALLWLALACSRRPETPATIEPSQQDAAVIRTADAQAAGQLLAGFHQIEQDAWRWTAHEFSVRLRTPAGAATRGALLSVQFALPEAVFAKTGPIVLSAQVNGAALPPQRFDKAGPQVFSAAVPAAALSGETVRADFTVDKFLAAGEADQRELAIIVSRVGLEAVP